MRTTAVLVALFVTGVVVPAVAGEDQFSSYWHDGKAEIDGYRLIVTCDGEPREGTAVLIYASEPEGESKPADKGGAPLPPETTAGDFGLKFIRDFRTGISDHRTMVSLFVRGDDFSPVKLSFTSAEWRGQIYEELVFQGGEIAGSVHSYIEGESGAERLKNAGSGVAEDNLFILVRGLRKDFLEPGAARKVKLLHGVYFRRSSHGPLEWEDAEISRAAAKREIEVPAGTFQVVVYEIRTAGGRAGRFFLEEDYPHRIVRWEMPPDVSAELCGSERLEYWKLNKNGDDSYREDIGLE